MAPLMIQAAPQSVFDDLVKVFGGEGRLGAGSLRSFFDFDRVIHEGMPLAAFRFAIASLEQPEKTVLEGIGVSRTMLRIRKKVRRLGFVDSERAVRLGFIIALGKVTLGSTAAAGRWLLKPNAALGGASPIQLLQTDVGARHVEAVLGRTLHGGFS
jgi:putative toxin-antitoxin system antitoxin component (TIGR02293 family)